MKLRNIINNIFEYLFIVLTILNFLSMYYRSPNKLIHLFINGIWEFILIYLFIIYFNRLTDIELKKYINFSTLYILIVSMFLILYYLYFPYSLYIIPLCLINPVLLIAVFLGNNHCNSDLLTKFENVSIILSIISLIAWSAYFIGVSPNSSLSVAFGNIVQVPSYFNIDFFPQGNTNFLGFMELPRNSSIFSEPSMFAYILCIAFLIELFINHKNHSNIINFNMIILFLTIISTTATTGIMIAGPSLLIYLIINVRSKILKTMFLIVFPATYIFFKFVMVNKASGDIASSYSIRMNDMYASFMAWKQHLFIGNGINNNDAISQFMYPFRFYIKNTGSSAGIPSALGYGGVIFGSFYILPNILSFKKNHNFLFFSFFILMLNVFTNVIMSYICIFILSYLWACILISYDNYEIN